MTPPWTGARFRSSPALELKRLEELPREQQAALAELQRDDDFYGVLVPRAGTMKSVGRQAAELFARLQSPATIDFPDDAWREDVLDLVLDGILEVEHEGAFVHGADAYPLLLDAPAAASDSLSTDALRHAEALATADVGQMTSALYSYNRLPRTRAWAARFPDREAVLAHLGASAPLDRHWTRTDVNSGWISWQPRVPRANPRDGITWKLYVSPRPEHIRDAFHALVRVLAAHEGAPMKIGPDAAGLLRPDKLVAYFATREELDAAARALANELRGCPAHGVPFTAAVEEASVLSWGADPPDSERALSWLDRESWRLWVAKSLASALSIAKQSASPRIAPWQFAIERVRRHGVDVATWAPSAKLWSDAA